MEISFSYITTFISLIYGLALAHSLKCIAEYIQNWASIKHFWVWWFWSVFILLLSVGFWWSLNGFYSQNPIKEISTFAFLTFQASSFYLMFFIFFNRYQELISKDLEIEFFKYKKYFFILLSVQFIMMFHINIYITSEIKLIDIIRQNGILNIQCLILFLLSFINNKLVHKISAATFLLLFMISIVFL